MKTNKSSNSITKFLSKNRYMIQIAVGAVVFSAVFNFHVSLLWIMGIGALTGIIFGKVFCRWMCPIGAVMEFMMKANPDDSFRSMYQYHKIGCPIAWVSGFLNKFSLFKVKLNKDTCKDCGLCDKSCYMPSIDKERFSLYKPVKENPAENFSCSKCLACVSSCPNGSLSFKLAMPFVKNLKK